MKTAEREGSCLALTDLKERQDSLEMVMNNHFFSVSLLFSSNNPLVISFFLLHDGKDVKTRFCIAEKRFEEKLLITYKVSRRSI